MVQKLLSSNKENTRNTTIELLKLCVVKGMFESVVQNLIQASKSKIPKLRSTSVNVLKISIESSKPTGIQLKIILSNLATLFEDSDEEVRKETTELACAIYCVIGDQIQPFIKSIRSTQLEQLNARFTQISSQKSDSVMTDINEESQIIQDSVMEDSNSLLDPVSVLDNIPKNLEEELSSPKWITRNEVLQKIVKLVEQPKLEKGDYNSLISRLIKVVNKDIHVQVVKSAVTILGHLSKVGPSIASDIKPAIGVLLSRFKKLGAGLADSIHQSLDYIEDKCLPFSDCKNDIISACKSDSPQVRIHTLQWIDRRIPLTKGKLQNILSSLAPCLCNLTGDANQQVRDLSCQALSKLILKLGEQSVSSYISKLDKLFQDKIKENLTALNGSSSQSLVQKDTISKMEPPTRPKSQPKSRPQSRSKESTPAASPRISNQKTSVKKQVAALQKIAPSITKENALIEAETLIPESIRTKLGDSTWKLRLEGIQEFKDYLISLGKEIENNTSVYIRYLEQFPSFTDSNIHVLTTTFECLEIIAKNSGTLKPSAAICAIPSLIEKLTQTKVKIVALSCLNAFSQYSNPQFVLSTSYPEILKQKNPKIIVEALNWIKGIVSGFGIKLISISELITFLKSCLENSNPQVKDSSIEILLTLKSCGAQNIEDQISDIKPVLLTKITNQLNTIQIKNDFTPSLELKGEITEEVKNLDYNSSERIDISGYLTNPLKDTESQAWATRLSMIENIQNILKQANYNIIPNITPLIRALKILFDDTNIRVVVESLKLLDNVGKSLGPEGEKYNNIIIQTLMTKLSNNTRQIRSSALTSLSEWSENVSFPPLVKHLSNIISNPNAHPEGRKGCMELLLKNFSKITQKHDILLMLVKHILLALTDKNPELRKLSESIIAQLIENIGRDVVLNEIPKLNLKPAVLRTIQPVIMRYEKKEDQIVEPEIINYQSTQQTHEITKHHPSPSKKLSNSLFILNQGKNSRELRDGGLHTWSFDPNSKIEMLNSVSSLLKYSVSPLLHKQMFSENFQAQVDAISTIIENLHIFSSEIKSSIDLFYIWISVLILDCNTTLLVKSLDFISKTILLYENEKITKYEASCILPMLIDKMGHNISSVRQRIHSLIKEFIQIIDLQILIQFLVSGMNSKSYRSRADSLTLISQLLKDFGTDAFILQQQLPQISNAIDDCEFVRSGAFLLFQQLYQSFGDSIVDISIPLKPQHREFLISKFNISIKGSDEVMEDVSQDQPAQENITNESINEEEDITLSDFSINTPVEDLISSVDVHPRNDARNEKSIEALKILSDIMHNNKRTFVLKTKLVVQKLTQLITIAFHCAAEKSVTPRLPKHILNCIMNLFEIKELASFIQKDDLMQSMEHLLLLLLDNDTIATLEDGQELNKAMNSLVIRILENANRTYMYTVLLNLLSKASSEPSSKQIRLIEIIVKCLLKITKQLSKTIDKIDVDIILMDVDQFLNSLEGYNCPTDLPLRSAKTILSELIKIKGESIRDHLTLIRASKNSPIEKYIQMILSSTRIDSNTEPKRKRQRITGPEEEIVQSNSKLENIFSMIRIESTCQDGLKELYKYQLQHPEDSIQPWMQQCSEPFQEYIKRQLKKIEQFEKEKQPSVDIYASKFKEIQQKYNINPTESSMPLFTKQRSLNNNSESVATSFESIRDQWKRQKRSSLQSNSTHLDFETLRQRFQSLPKRSNSITSESPITLEILKKRMEITSESISSIQDKENLPH